MQNYSYFATSSLNPPADIFFFGSEDSQPQQDLTQKKTRPHQGFNISAFDDLCHPQNIKRENIEKDFKKESSPRLERSKKFLQLGPKMRKKYLEAKKGNRFQTNQLSINVHTLLKGILEQITLFVELQQEDLDKIKAFKDSKPNLLTIKEIMGNGQKDGQNNRKKINEKIRQYILENIQSAQLVKKILQSSKMSLRSKMTMIKYLGSLQNLCEKPSNFSQWKQPLL